jgi:excisionase family DNA binding protein
MSEELPSDLKEKLFVGRQHAARLIDVSTRTIDDAIRHGELPAYRLGRRVLIDVKALIHFVERERYP